MSDTSQHGTERVVCNLCGADDARELYRRADYRYEIDTVEWPLVQCRRCGLAYLNPRPSPDAIWRYYPKTYYNNRAVLQARYELQAQQLAHLTPGTLLDIGCANGDWIALMRQRGWQVAGLEPSPNSENPHGLSIQNESIDRANYAPESFDVITAWAVFEHLHEPMDAFRAAQRWLKPGGRLIIVVTNIRSLFSRFAYQEDVPRHLHVFSERTLGGYAAATGLVLESVVHDTKMFGGSGRGVLRVRLLSALGVPRLRYFQAMKLPVRDRLRRFPALSLAITPLALVERVLLPDWLVRRLRLSGNIVVTMQKPGGLDA